MLSQKRLRCHFLGLRGTSRTSAAGLLSVITACKLYVVGTRAVRQKVENEEFEGVCTE